MGSYRPGGPQAKRVSVPTPSGGRVLTRSALEAAVLRDLTKRKVAWLYESEDLPWVETHTYTPDIVISKKSGESMYIEVKGYFTPADRSKMLHVSKQNPDADIRFVFQRGETKLSKASKTTYTGWCKKHGFPVAEGRVPKAWVEE